MVDPTSQKVKLGKVYLGQVQVDSPKLDEQVKGGGECDFSKVPTRVLDLETETVVYNIAVGRMVDW